MKTLTYRRAMSQARKIIRLTAKIPKDSPNIETYLREAYRYKDLAVRLAHSDAERAAAQAL